MTIFCNVNEVKEEVNGYTTYVMEVLESDEVTLHGFKYLTCTRFPNWSDPILSIGDKGYLNYRDIKEGVDLWYNDANGDMVPYKYSFTQYVKFVPYKDSDHECRL